MDEGGAAEAGLMLPLLVGGEGKARWGATVSAVKVAQTNQRRPEDENSQPQHFPLSASHQISCEI